MVPNLTRIQSTSFLKLSLPLILEVTFIIVVTNLVIWMLSVYADKLAGAIAIDELLRGINLFVRWKSKRWQAKSLKLYKSLLN
jgi:hypothetical protein